MRFSNPADDGGMASEVRTRILVVEDEPISAKYVKRCLEALGFEVVGHAKSGEEALRLAVKCRPDLVLMDIILEGDLDGIQTAEQLRWRIDVPVVYLTANSDPTILHRAKLTNPSGFLIKPFDVREIQNILEIALFRHRSEVNQRLYHRAVNASVSAIFIADAQLPDWPIIQVNPAFEQVTGYDAKEAIGQSCCFLEGVETDPATLAQLRLALEQHNSCGVTILLHRKDGTTFWNELTLSPVPDASGWITHFVGVQHDVTVLRSLEKQLNQAQKLESIGQLAAGIAHEINTPTQYIGDNTRFLLEGFSDLNPYFAAQARLLEAAKAGTVTPEIIAAAESATHSADLDYLTAEIPKAIGQSLEGIERVSRIVLAMKEFSHPGVKDKVNMDLNHAIDSTLTVCRNEWKYVAEVVTEFDPSLPLVSCLPGEINQTILNLVVNASHAIADVVGDGSHGKGTITISTRRDGEQVEICLRDTGAGVPEKIRQRIFDPFFTTKEVGKGTGQGLAIAWTVIVERHGGTLHLESEIGNGTTFIIRLPIQAPASGKKQQAA